MLYVYLYKVTHLSSITKIKKYSYLCLCMARIVHINTVADTYTGVGGVIASLAAYQRCQGLDVSIVAGYIRPEFETFADYVMCGRIRHNLAVLEVRLRDNDGRLCRCATRRLTAWFDRLGDVAAIHLHNIHGYYIDATTLMTWAWKHNVKVVVTMHDHWWCTGRCAYIPGGCDNDCYGCKHPDVYPATWLDFGGKANFERFRRRCFVHKMINASARFVAPSDAIAKIAYDRLGIHTDVIRNGIDDTIFFPGKEKHKSASEIHVIAVAATWTPAKGLDILRAVAMSLPREWRLTVTGKDAPVAMSPQIIIEDRVTPTEMASLYRDADVLLSTATAEAFGMTVAEAMACGVPAVVNSSTATAEQVKDGINGYAIDMSPKHPEPIIEALSRASSLRSTHSLTTLSAVQMAEEYAPLYGL